MKKRLLCPHLPRKGTPAVLSESEAHHALRVLRLKEGQLVEALDGNGQKVLGVLRTLRGDPRVEYLEAQPPDLCQPLGKPNPNDPKTTFPQESSAQLHLEMAILKADAMEWVVQKSVELGVHTLTPVLTDHTVVQMKSKSPAQFRDRWQKIADQALKQCGRLQRLEIQTPTPLSTLLAHSSHLIRPWVRVWADEACGDTCPSLLECLDRLKQTTLGAALPSIHILIGPEGGWSVEERTLLIQESLLRQNSSNPNSRIGLGRQILRAETAALFTISVVAAELQWLERKRI
jgi:16S rRNA (uracil1498-N3)-methyltransferase